MRREEGSLGKESNSGGRFFTTGNTVPPVRAVLDGVNGASRISMITTA